MPDVVEFFQMAAPPDEADKAGKVPQLPHEEFYLGYGISLTTATIDVWGDIDPDTCQTAIQGIHLIRTAHERRDVDPPPLTIKINSQGGDWYSGMALYGAIKAYPGKTTAVVQGMAMSMGSIILQAADHRQAYPHSTIMVHNGHDEASGNIEEVKRWTRHAELVCKTMYTIYAGRSGKTERYWKMKCAIDFICDASKSLKEGLIDEII